MYGLILWFRFKVCISSFFTLRSVVSLQELWWWWSRSWYGLGRWDPERKDHMTHTVINEGDIWIILNEVNKKGYYIKAISFNLSCSMKGNAQLIQHTGSGLPEPIWWSWFPKRTQFLNLSSYLLRLNSNTFIGQVISKTKYCLCYHTLVTKYFVTNFFYFLFLTYLFLWLRNFPASWTW